MIRVVLDTNVLVSAAIKTEGAEAAALDFVAQHHATLVVSEATVAEYIEVLRRPRLRLDPARVEWLLQFIRHEGVMVAPVARLNACTDEPDNRFLECAEVADADYLVTGNKRHFPPSWKSARIVNAREFLQAVA